LKASDSSHVENTVIKAIKIQAASSLSTALHQNDTSQSLFMSLSLWCKLYKTFFFLFCIDAATGYTKAFVLDKIYQSSAAFVGKARAHPSGASNGSSR
jgi:hypothetical protein